MRAYTAVNGPSDPSCSQLDQLGKTSIGQSRASDGPNGRLGVCQDTVGVLQAAASISV